MRDMAKKNGGGKRWAARSTLLLGLRAQRQRRGITQRELAELAGTTQGTVWQLEALHRGAYPCTVKRLCKALDITPEDLISGGNAQR